MFGGVRIEPLPLFRVVDNNIDRLVVELAPLRDGLVGHQSISVVGDVSFDGKLVLFD